MSYLIFRDQKSFMGYFGQKPGIDTEKLYWRLVSEEVLELAGAMADFEKERTDATMAEVAKEALDCIYVLSGLLHAMNLDPQALWDAVHESNIAKIKHPCAACDGQGWLPAGDPTNPRVMEPCSTCKGQGHVYEVRRREDGKVLKPAGWQPPNIVPLVAMMRSQEVR